jgi:hypothetical protein
VVASLLGKALMLSSGSEVVGLKPTPLIKLIYHRNHLRGTHKLFNKYKLNAPSDHRKIRILRIKSAAIIRGPWYFAVVWVPRLNLRVGEIRKWQLRHGFGTQPKRWGVRGAQARSKLLSNLRGAGRGRRAQRPDKISCVTWLAHEVRRTGPLYGNIEQKSYCAFLSTQR